MSEPKKPPEAQPSYSLSELCKGLLLGPVGPRRPIGALHIAFRGDKALARRVAAAARKVGVTPSQLMRGLVMYGLGQLERGEIQVTTPQEVIVTPVKRP